MERPVLYEVVAANRGQARRASCFAEDVPSLAYRTSGMFR
jgi:hypothetical protein